MAHDFPGHGLQLQKKHEKIPKSEVFTLEQPASPKDYMPETLSFWVTKEWASLKEEFGWGETTFAQRATRWLRYQTNNFELEELGAGGQQAQKNEKSR